jgi:hypothetical protein
MRRAFGPTRGEHIFRLCAGIGGIVLLIGVLVVQGVPKGPALVELFGFGGLFFAGSAGWSGWKLWTGDHP